MRGGASPGPGCLGAAAGAIARRPSPPEVTLADLPIGPFIATWIGEKIIDGRAAPRCDCGRGARPHLRARRSAPRRRAPGPRRARRGARGALGSSGGTLLRATAGARASQRGEASVRQAVQVPRGRQAVRRAASLGANASCARHRQGRGLARLAAAVARPRARPLPPADLDRTAAPDAYDRRHGPPDAWEGVADADAGPRAERRRRPHLRARRRCRRRSRTTLLASRRRSGASPPPARHRGAAAPIARTTARSSPRGRRFAGVAVDSARRAPPPAWRRPRRTRTRRTRPTAGDAVPEVDGPEGVGVSARIGRRPRSSSGARRPAAAQPPCRHRRRRRTRRRRRRRRRGRVLAEVRAKRFMRPSALFAQDNRAAVLRTHPGDSSGPCRAASARCGGPPTRRRAPPTSTARRV